VRRNFLAHSQGDAINPILAAVGYNFRLILKWLRAFLCKIIAAIWVAIMPFSALRAAS
jgi:IS5 family transposase